jgi:hypothetical protein
MLNIWSVHGLNASACSEKLGSMPAVSSESDQHACITIAGCIRKEDLQFLQPSCICLHLWYSCLQANMTLTQQNNTGILNAAAGPPKGIAKLLTVSESGRMRSPPLVEKFRRAKENMLQNWQSQPINGKLLSLERMFHEVSRCVRHTVCGLLAPTASPCVGCIHPLPHPVWVLYTHCLTLCGFQTPPASTD